jgi:hypothetical protein
MHLAESRCSMENISRQNALNISAHCLLVVQIFCGVGPLFGMSILISALPVLVLLKAEGTICISD